MPTTHSSIAELARDFAEGSELAAALGANRNEIPEIEPEREPWMRRWLDLSDWARHRELRRWNRAMHAALDDLAQVNESAEQKVSDALQQCADAETFFKYVVFCHDPAGTSEISQRLSETQPARDQALEALKAVAQARRDHAEAKAAVMLAELRSRHAFRHFTELARVRTKTAAATFLLTIVVIVATALLLHFRMGAA